MKPKTEPALPATIFEILQASEKAKPVQEIADEVKISYADTMEHLAAIGKNVQLRFLNLPNGVLTVEILRVAGEI
jgi:hypothetical protein